MSIVLMNRLCLMIFIFWSTFSLGAQQQFNWPSGKKAALSLSFDDARLSHPEIAPSLFKKLNTQVTFYVVPSGVEQRLDGWKQIVKDGHEIGNHTLNHPCTGNFSWSRDNAIENYSLAAMRNELLTANLQIQELLGVTPISFAYTCGNTYVGRGEQTESLVPLVAELFDSGRGWLNEAPNDPSFTDLSLLQGIEMDGKDFENDIKPMLDAAVSNGSWLLLAGHEIGTDGSQTTRIEMLEKLVEYVQQPNSGIWLAPVGTVASHIKKERHTQAKILKEALSFCATFDHGLQADLGGGDSNIFSGKDYDHADIATLGLLPEEVQIAINRGYFGSALEFKRKGEPAVFYPAKGNISYNNKDWNGTISLWLSVDPEKDLAPGYTDPIQITDSGYDDAALWVDFSDKNPRSFRMGVFGDREIWNPNQIGPDVNPGFLNRLVTAVDRPFSRDKWTHVVISFTHLNQKNGQASFYINGRLQGTRDISETFTWDIEKAKIFLGLNFIGLIDEIAIFNRSLTNKEVGILYSLTEGIQSLLDKK